MNRILISITFLLSFLEDSEVSKEENNNHGEGVNCKSQNIMRKSQEETLREMPVESYFPIVKPIISGRV